MKNLISKLISVVLLFTVVFANDAILTGKYIATGYSAKNQSRFAAILSARVDAQRQLLEQIKGTHIDSTTTIENGMLKSDLIVTKINGILKNARVIKSTYDPKEGMASVTLAVGFNEVVANILSDKNLIKEINKDVNTSSKEIVGINEIKETIYDGVIIDTRGLGMEPAIINRVFYKKQLIYDPTKVPQSVVVERGLAAYTINTNKAKAILDSYGSKNPLIVKAIKLGNKKSDVEISKEDAKKITYSDEKNGFLSSAKIVFIVDN